MPQIISMIRWWAAAHEGLLSSISLRGFRQYHPLSRQYYHIGIGHLIVEPLLTAIEGNPEKEKPQGDIADDVAEEPHHGSAAIYRRAISVD